MLTFLGHKRSLRHLVRAPIYALNYARSLRELRTNPNACSVRPFDDPDAVWAEINLMADYSDTLQVDVRKFWDFFVEAAYDRRGYTARPPGLYEKALEHYLSFVLARLRPGETLIDVAADKSPAADIARDVYGACSYKQDLKYRAGIHGQYIGGNACSMPVPDNFADVVVLHCSFEHFEGDADTRLLKEMERVLKPGGRLCILPLYVMSTYHVHTGMFLFHRGLPVDSGALLYLDRRYGARFGRCYDPIHLRRRVLNTTSVLELGLVRLTNASDIHPTCYLQFILLGQKPLAASEARQRVT